MLTKWLNDPHGKPPYDPATGTLSWTLTLTLTLTKP